MKLYYDAQEEEYEFRIVFGHSPQFLEKKFKMKEIQKKLKNKNDKKLKIKK